MNRLSRNYNKNLVSLYLNINRLILVDVGNDLI